MFPDEIWQSPHSWVEARLHMRARSSPKCPGSHLCVPLPNLLLRSMDEGKRLTDRSRGLNGRNTDVRGAL